MVQAGRGWAVWAKLGALAALACLGVAAADGAGAAVPPSEPWPQLKSDVPADPAVRFGTLPNGMRYAIMRNATPKDEVSIRLRIDAGSLMEAPDQSGLAHMVEHMSFRGTTHVPEDQEWKDLQRLGMAMGADVSAFTTESQTFYQFDLPHADRKTLDTGLMRMRETASEILFKPDALDAERGTILSEERIRDTPGYRTVRAELSFFYKGQQIADHAPIGTVDHIQHASPDALRAFYRAFYRPERATLIVVGDVDPRLVEARVRAHFADWRGVGSAGVDRPLGPPLPRGPETQLIVDPKLSRQITVAWISPYDDSVETQARVMRRVVENIGLTIVNRRFQRMASKPDRPFLSANLSHQGQGRSAEATMLSTDVDPGQWRGALIAADVTRRQVLQFGVSQDEVDREVAAFRADYQANADGAATRPTPALASALLGSVDSRYVFTSPAESLAVIKKATDGLTAAQVTDALRGMFTGSGPLVFVSSPIPIDGGQATVTAAFKEAETLPITAPAKDADLVWPYTHFGDPGRVVDQKTIPDLGVTEVRFANGVRLTVKPTKFSADQVQVQVRIGNGLNALPRDRDTGRWAADAGAYILGGLKAISYEDMEQALADKVYAAAFAIHEDSFVLGGGTTRKDLDTQMQVLAAYVTDPGWRKEAFDRVRATISPMLNNIAAEPNSAMHQAFNQLARSGDPRWAAPTRADIAFTRLDDVRAVLDGPLASGAIEITMVGDVTPERAIETVAATFGALPPRPAPTAPAPDELDVHFPAPTATPVLRRHRGRPDQAMAVIAWPSADFYSDPQRSRNLRLLEQIIQVRIFEQLRIADGASYVPETGLETSTVYPGYGHIYAAAEVPPDKIDLFYSVVKGIVADLRDHPVSQDELDRVQGPRVDLFTKSQQTNDYWLSALSGAQADPRKLDIIRSTIPDLQHVTVADIQAAAQAYLKDDTAWEMEVLPVPAAAAAGAVATLVGKATISCAVEATKLTDCRPVREDPPGQGLGFQAVAWAGKLPIDPAKAAKIDGQRVEFSVRVAYPDPTAN